MKSAANLVSNIFGEPRDNLWCYPETNTLMGLIVPDSDTIILRNYPLQLIITGYSELTECANIVLSNDSNKQILMTANMPLKCLLSMFAVESETVETWASPLVNVGHISDAYAWQIDNDITIALFVDTVQVAEWTYDTQKNIMATDTYFKDSVPSDVIERDFGDVESTRLNLAKGLAKSHPLTCAQ